MIPKVPTQEVSHRISQHEESKLLKLDFHTKKEIALKDISPYSTTIPLKQVQRKNVKPETMLYNLTKAINYSEKAAKLNYTKAFITLGNCYLNGEGVDKDYKKQLNTMSKQLI